MAPKKSDGNQEKERKHWHHHNGPSGAVYGMGFIGAIIYYLQQAFSIGTFGAVVLAILKAIIWPVLLVYNLMKYLLM